MGMNDGTRPPAFTISAVYFDSEVPLCMKVRRRFPISGRTTARESFSFRNFSRSSHCVPFPEPEMPKNATVIGCIVLKIVAPFLEDCHDFSDRFFQFAVHVAHAIVVLRRVLFDFLLHHAHALGE